MTKLHLLERCLRICCFTFLGVLLVLVLAACGPGSGGTGTGPVQSFSSIASASGGAGPSPSPGGGSSIDGCGRLDLLLQEGRVELLSGCGNFVFVGGWAADAEGKLVLEGVLESPGPGGSVRATLSLQFNGAPESQSVTVTVTDEAGRVLAGPTLLGRV
jgi:hypothetical protein